MDLSEKGVFKMTLEEALRFIDPETDMDALAEVEYYNGFKGKEAAAKTLREASQMVVDFVRRVSLILSVVYRGTMPKPRRLSTMKAGRTQERSTAAS